MLAVAKQSESFGDVQQCQPSKGRAERMGQLGGGAGIGQALTKLLRAVQPNKALP